MNDFRAEHIERFHAFNVALPMATAFKLFEPEGERAWAVGWDGNQVLRDMTEARYRDFIASWAQSISRATGAAAQ